VFLRFGNRGLLFSPSGVLGVDFSTPGDPVGGQTVDVYSYLNSLHNHANPSSDQDANTRVGNWVARMAAQAPNGGNVYTLGATFGFVSSWDVPPIANTEHEEVTTPHVNQFSASWTGASEVEVVQFVPDNFDGFGFDPADVTNLGVSYQTRLLELIDAWETNAPNANRRYVVYAGLLNLQTYGGTGDDPTTINSAGYASWVSDNLGSYQTWMELLVSRLQAARPTLDIRLHQISKAYVSLFANTVVGDVAPGVLFEDLAPHGRSTTYFLLAVAEYIELFGEKPPADFVFEPEWDVDTLVVDNYQAIVDHVWGVLA
jgi:hypothetical protein